MEKQKNSHVYIEWLKTTSQVKNNDEILCDCFWTWGSHDFIKIKIMKKDDTPEEAMQWFKSTYENAHSLLYDGVEHQPLFLTTCTPLEDTTISHLCEKRAANLFILTLFQIDYSYSKKIYNNKTINEIDQERLLNIISDKIENDSGDTSKLISKQVFLDWGEADIAILFETDDAKSVSDIIMKFREGFPVVRSYSLIILPYTYKELGNWKDPNSSDKVNEIQENLSKWFKDENGNPLEISTHYMTDTSHQMILNKGMLYLIFGDYDVQNVSSVESFTSELHNPAAPGDLYRYSKTTPLIPIKNTAVALSPTEDHQSDDHGQYAELINKLRESFNEVVVKINDIFDDTIKDTLKKNFESAKYTLINLANYFARLHETKHTPDVYIHLKSVFVELTNALNALKEETEQYGGAAVSREVIREFFFEFDVDIKVLMSKMQQFLGIVSLSPRAFSEAHGSYMRSANAALKLVCAYHAAVYFMHQATKQSIKGEPPSSESSECTKIEHENCAVLILPSRDAETINTTLFTSITPAHHMCIIEANFKSLFNVKEMLFLLAHEVGHFSGDRLRDLRQSLVIKSAVRHMIFEGIFIELLSHPYAKLMGDFCFSDAEKKNVDDLDQELDHAKEQKNEVVEAINAISDEIAEELSNKLMTHQADLPESDEYVLPLKFKYMEPSIDAAMKQFKKHYNEIIGTNSFEEKLNKIVKALLNWIQNLMEKVYLDHSDIPTQLKRMASARVMYETSLEGEYTKYFGELNEETFYFNMKCMRTVFADIFSDIYATNILNVKKDDYIKYIFSNRLNINSYADPLFLSRIIIVLRSRYSITNDKALFKMINKAIPKDWTDEIMSNIRFVMDYQDFYLTYGSDYAEAVKNNLNFPSASSEYKKIELIQKFYNDPENNLYAIWLKGLMR